MVPLRIVLFLCNTLTEVCNENSCFFKDDGWTPKYEIYDLVKSTASEVREIIRKHYPEICQ